MLDNVTMRAFISYYITSTVAVKVIITAFTVHAESTLEGENVGADAAQNSGKPTSQAADKIYRYVNAEGRESFTNILEKVPVDAREQKEELGSSNIALTPESAQKADRSKEPPDLQIQKTGYLATVRREWLDRVLEWTRTLWRDYAPFVVVGAIVLLLLLVTPTALRKVSAPDWARTLTWTIQFLTVFAVLAFLVVQANRKFSRLGNPGDSCQGADCASRVKDKTINAYQKSIENYKKVIDQVNKEAGATGTKPGLASVEK
jgi:hypothetical protein